MIPKYNNYFYGMIDLKAFHVTKTQLRILFVINMTPDITMSELADRIATSREQATRAVNPLVKRKLLIRKTDAKNRRQLKITMSDEGLEFLYNIVSEFIDCAGSPFQALSEEELDAFHDAIGVITRTMNKIALQPLQAVENHKPAKKTKKAKHEEKPKRKERAARP
jgi:DNA-binding MarR family transcriptional regulator